MHQYISRKTGKVCTEYLFNDKYINTIYSTVREKAPFLFNLCVSNKMSSLLAWINYDMPFGSKLSGAKKMIRELNIDLQECIQPANYYNNHRRIFERQIRYWESRPMPEDNKAVVSPADSKMLVASLKENNLFFIKEKFFSFEELLGKDKARWLQKFSTGDIAIFRLTPEKYHYNHVPVSGKVVDIYEIDGNYNACNPGAVVELATPFSKNKRVVTIIDTDVEGGSDCGLVAMIEVVALMIGKIEQAYSQHKYDNPRPLQLGMMLQKGKPKSLYRPGSSLDILMFEPQKVVFDQDIIDNLQRKDASSRYSLGFGQSLVETDVDVRMSIATAL